MILDLNLSGDTNQIKRKGRKPKKANYFDVEEENAVLDFLASNSSEERNKIYNEIGRAHVWTPVT